jgi:uncharacterized integral membrane protein (TIGR00698 family)
MNAGPPLKTTERAINPRRHEVPQVGDRPDHADATAASGPAWNSVGVRLLPGILLAVSIAIAAMLIRMLPGLSIFSAMIVAAVLGMGIRNLFGRGESFRPGIEFATRLPLRAGIVLLGLQLTLWQLASIGAEAFAVVILSLVCTFAAMAAIGRLIKVDAGLACLLAVGTSICGAAAIVAANSVVRAKDGDVGYALGCITVLGTIAMLLYPPIAIAIGMEPTKFGVWTGASIHEVAQVVGAAFQYGSIAGEAGTIAKLTRVLMLAPVILLLPFIMARGKVETGARVPTPWFVFGFVAMVVINSVLPIPAAVTAAAGQVAPLLLAIALAAMGLETDLRLLNSRGVRPLILAGLGTIFISLFSLILIKLLMLP